MTHATYFEIGGELIELHADMQYGSGGITAKKRKQQRATARDVKSIGKDVKKLEKTVSSSDSWGPAEEFGIGFGLGVGIAYSVATLPVAAVDGPLPVLDLAWFAASVRFTQKSINTFGSLGAAVDDKMGWE